MIEDYLKPQTASEAVGMKKKYGADACYYSGGTQVNRLNSQIRVSTLISLEDLDLGKVEKAGNGVKIGAKVSIEELKNNSLVPSALQDAAGFVGSMVVRGMATIGGNIGANLKDSYLVPALLSYKAVLSVESESGSSEVALWDYLKEGREDLITAIVIADPARNVIAKRISRTKQTGAILSLAIGCTCKSNDDYVIAICGGDKKISRLESVESKLNSGSISTTEEVQKAIQSEMKAVSDVWGSAEYKKYIAGIYSAEVFNACKG